MSKNVLGIAVKLAETKYKSNVAVKAILESFNFSKQMFELSKTIIEGHDPLDNYSKGIQGIDGYAHSDIDPGTIEYMLVSPTKRLLLIAEIQAKADCLIMVLKALGEEI